MVDTSILSLEEIAKALKDRRLYIVAKETGLSFPTLKKLADGADENYTIETLRAVTDYIRGNKTSKNAK